MIVTCERCETQFQLDDARVPPTGVRVRCSRCKHAFQVMRSEGRSLVDAQAAAPSAPVRSEAEDEESDWQFNEDLPSQDPDVSGRFEAPPPESADADPSADAEFGWDAEDDPEPASAADVDDPFEARGLEQSGLDLLEDLDRSAGPRPQPAAAAAPAPAPAFPVAEVAVGGVSTAAALPRPASEIAAEADAAGSDEIASPDPGDWALFSEEDDASEPGGKRRLPPVVPAAVRGEDEASAPRWSRWIVAASHSLGGSLVAVSFLYGLAGAWPVASPTEGPPRHALAGDLEVAGASGRWVENAVHGPLYVVSGSLWNTGSRSASPPALQLEWLDRDGRLLSRTAADASAPRRHETLREAPLSELASAPPLAAAGVLPPGAGLPFELVVDAIPPGAAHFQLAVSVAPTRGPGRGSAPSAAAPRPSDPGGGAFDAAAAQAAHESPAPPGAPGAEGPDGSAPGPAAAAH